MTNRFLPGLAVAALLVLGVAPQAAASVIFDVAVSGTVVNPYDPIPGDEITLDIRIRSTGTPVLGVGAAVYGYDSGLLEFVSGNAVGSFLHDVCIPATGCFDGLDNQDVGALSEGSYAGVGDFVQFATAVSTVARTGTGIQDQGLDGVVGGGDAQFRVTFRVIAPGGPVSFLVGTSTNPTLGNVIVLPGLVFEQSVTQVWLIPEPNTVWLVGVGLAALSGLRRRG